MANEIEKTPLWADIRKIIQNSSKPTRYKYRAILHTEKDDIEFMQFVSLDIVRDYANNIGDHLHLTATMPLGDYILRMFPYKNNFEVTIRRDLLAEAGDQLDTKVPPELERYKGVFLVNENMNPKSGEFDQIDKQTLDRMDLVTVQLQLLDRSLEPLRIKTVIGVYKDISQLGLIHSLLGGESSKVLVDGKVAIDGLDIVEPDNKETKKMLVIPNGTLVTGLTTFLHEQCNGIYTAGLGSYLQSYGKKRMWFVYPLFDIKRFDTDKRDKAIFYMVPQNRYTALERTYRKEDSVIHIAATGGKSYQDDGETGQMDSGNGFRMSEARSFMKKPVNMTADGPTSARSQINHETVGESRKDGLNYAPMASTAISSNPFIEYSKIAQKMTGRIDLTWENAAPSELYPGMPCKYMFLENDIGREVKGTIAFVHVSVQLIGQGMIAKAHSTTCHVTIACEKIVKLEKKEEVKQSEPVAGKSETQSKVESTANKVPAANAFSEVAKDASKSLSNLNNVADAIAGKQSELAGKLAGASQQLSSAIANGKSAVSSGINGMKGAAASAFKSAMKR